MPISSPGINLPETRCASMTFSVIVLPIRADSLV